jgi:DNA (cytosine-5)-methyltransferase 1
MRPAECEHGDRHFVGSSGSYTQAVTSYRTETGRQQRAPMARRTPTTAHSTMNSNGRSTEPHEGDSDGKDGCALTVGSLFSGIGGLDLGFERAGFNIAWQCEKDSYCQKVLNKHWPNTPCYDNIEDLHRADGPQPDADILIGGFPCQDISLAGFPCQDISLAGEGAGLDGDRSGLWWEYRRVIGAVEPEYAVVENVAAFSHRGLDAVLGSLAEGGYDAEWTTLSAKQFGALHRRERLFLVAYDSEKRVSRLWPKEIPREQRISWCEDVRGVEDLRGRTDLYPSTLCGSRDGLPAYVDRIAGVGNAVVPQVAQFVAQCVREHAARTRAPRVQTECLDDDVPTDAGG